MTCVLSMSSLYQSQYNGNITDIQNAGFKYLDFNWVNSGSNHSGFQERCICCGQYQIDTGNGSPKVCHLKIGNGISGNIMHGSQLNTEVSNKHDLLYGLFFLYFHIIKIC